MGKYIRYAKNFWIKPWRNINRGMDAENVRLMYPAKIKYPKNREHEAVSNIIFFITCQIKIYRPYFPHDAQPYPSCPVSPH
jgi:hypothetical protein